MSRNGTGTYSPPSNSWSPATNGNAATAADWNATLTDLSNALTQSVSADGQTPITGNLNLGNNRITNVAAPSANGDVLVQGSAVTAPTLTSSGNVNFTGTGNRITGDFSNATVANRVMFQTSTTNSASIVGVIPNGTSQVGLLEIINNSTPTNSSFFRTSIDGGTSYIEAGRYGTGSFLPMTIFTGGAERVRIDTSGNVIINSGNLSANGLIGGYNHFYLGGRPFRRVNAGNAFEMVNQANTVVTHTFDDVGNATFAGSLGAVNATFTGTVTATNLFGQGQTWQNVTGSRALATTYTNTTGRPIVISIGNTSAAGGNNYWSISVNGSVWGYTSASVAAASPLVGNFIVPVGASYAVTNASGTTTLGFWNELR